MAVTLFALLAAVYALTYSGTFMTDDEHILSSRAISLAFDEKVDNLRVAGNSRVFELSKLPPEALNIEPMQAFLGIPLLYLAQWLHSGSIQTLFLMNIWATAASATVLFYIILIEGYPRSTALVTALLFGLGTSVWPYARTFFRDPLAMFFLLCAWLFFELILSRQEEPMRPGKAALLWAVFSITFAAGVFIKNTVIIALPLFMIRLIARFFFQTRWECFFFSMLKKTWIPFLILSALILTWLLWIPSIDLLGRASPNYYGYLFRLFTATHRTGVFETVAGTLVSPGKSIFLYSPILLLSLLSLFRRPTAGWPAWVYLLFLCVGQGLFYQDLWAGIVNWGLRFTLPAIPLLMAAGAPVIEDAINSRRGRIGLLCLGLVSGAVQLIGVLTPVEKFYADIAVLDAPGGFQSLPWKASASSLLWAIRWLSSGQAIDIALARMPLGGLWIGALCVGLISICLVNLKAFRLSLAAAAFLACLGLPLGMTIIYKADPSWVAGRSDLQASLQFINDNRQTGDRILIKSYGSPVWYFWMNWASEMPFTSLPYYYPRPDLVSAFRQTHNPVDALNHISLVLLDQELSRNERLWLVVPSDSPGSGFQLEREWLRQNAFEKQARCFTETDKATCVFLFTPISLDCIGNLEMVPRVVNKNMIILKSNQAAVARDGGNCRPNNFTKDGT